MASTIRSPRGTAVVRRSKGEAIAAQERRNVFEHETANQGGIVLLETGSLLSATTFVAEKGGKIVRVLRDGVVFWEVVKE